MSGFMLLLGGEVNATIWYMNEEADRHRQERHRLAGHRNRHTHGGEEPAPKTEVKTGT
jgi:hypothetical protein